MKLRIKGNALRLRLSRSEVARLADLGRVEEAATFGAGQQFIYSVESSAEVSTLTATLHGSRIHLRVPTNLIRSWASSEQVGIEGDQPVEGGEPLRLLVEKDFECLDAPASEDQADAFPHPLRGSPCPPGKSRE